MRKRSVATRAAVISVAATLLLGGAAAASGTAHTSLSLKRHPGGKVAPGTVVTFSGKLESSKTLCESKEKVKLVRVGSGVVSTTTTSASGAYSFHRKVSKTHKWEVRFDGHVSGVHPNTTTCLKSTSHVISIPVS